MKPDKKVSSIPDEKIVRVKEMGNVVEILYSEHTSRGGSIRKLDRDHYVALTTGEYCEFSHEQNRADDVDSVHKSMGKLRDIINANVIDTECCRWMTLTYADNMRDPQRLLCDFRNFNKRCRNLYGNYKYIAVAEPQGRGAWHLHVILIFARNAPYMDNSAVAQLWRQGYVNIRHLDNVDNVGAYLTAYLGDVELDDYREQNPNAAVGEYKAIQQIDESGNITTKRYVKGARLSMYPPGFHLFRCSKGIQRPQKQYMSYRVAKAKVGESALTYRKAFNIEKADGFENRFIREVYNTKRKRM